MKLNLKLDKLNTEDVWAWCGPRNRCVPSPRLFLFCFRLHYNLCRGPVLQAETRDGDTAMTTMPCSNQCSTVVFATEVVICWQTVWAENMSNKKRPDSHPLTLSVSVVQCMMRCFLVVVSGGLVWAVGVTEDEKKMKSCELLLPLSVCAQMYLSMTFSCPYQI